MSDEQIARLKAAIGPATYTTIIWFLIATPFILWSTQR